MASAHRRHRDSLERLINFSSSPPLTEEARNQAETIFYAIVDHFRDQDPSNDEYDRTALVRYTYEYALTEKAKDNLLQAFFRSITIPLTDTVDVDLINKEKENEIWLKLAGFADYLLNNFFLPLKASTKRTPQPSPAYHSATQSIRVGGQSFVGTPLRLSTLRGTCLIRDRHRCVISHSFDRRKALERIKQSGDEARDDDGQLLTGQTFDSLEVAHILPHSLVNTNSDVTLDSSREGALQILNMFDTDVVHFIEGPDIDRPRNAMTLTHNLHQDFGDFQIYFEPEAQANTYRINTFLPAAIHNFLPVTRELFLTEDRTIEPPSPRFLAIHRAIAHILYLSAAGAFIDTILNDFDQRATRADGTTHLGELVNLKVNGWLSRPVAET
ncbi:hypothetical protein ARSEF4850_009385 [Beauveria asiatica]